MFFLWILSVVVIDTYYPQAFAFINTYVVYASKEWNQNVYENKLQVMYVNEKYDQCERASDFSSALIYNDWSLKKSIIVQVLIYILVCQLPSFHFFSLPCEWQKSLTIETIDLDWSFMERKKNEETNV
jgi:hypothetical protein